MSITPILLSCLLMAQAPFGKILQKVEQTKDCWIIYYRFNQDLQPNFKFTIEGKVSIFQSAVHNTSRFSSLSSDKPKYCISNSLATGKCYEIMTYNVFDKRSLSIKINHKCGDYDDDPLCGKRVFKIKNGEAEFVDVLYLHSGDLH